MSTKATDRVELRAPPERTERWRRAAERAGVSLSDWARRRLDHVADEELCDDEEGPPSEAGIEIALSAYGVLGKERGEELRARVHAEEDAMARPVVAALARGWPVLTRNRQHFAATAVQFHSEPQPSTERSHLTRVMP